VESKLKEHNLDCDCLNEVKPRDLIRIDKLEIEFIRVSHSIPDAMGIDCSIKRAGGDPASLVIDLVENNKEYDLIIMGNRRINKFQELVFGSVSDKVTRLVKIPVLVIK
jgi:nucleotide-binding universal stress UspA family protein